MSDDCHREVFKYVTKNIINRDEKLNVKITTHSNMP